MCITHCMLWAYWNISHLNKHRLDCLVANHILLRTHQIKDIHERERGPKGCCWQTSAHLPWCHNGFMTSGWPWHLALGPPIGSPVPGTPKFLLWAAFPMLVCTVCHSYRPCFLFPETDVRGAVCGSAGSKQTQLLACADSSSFLSITSELVKLTLFHFPHDAVMIFY